MLLQNSKWTLSPSTGKVVLARSPCENKRLKAWKGKLIQPPHLTTARLKNSNFLLYCLLPYKSLVHLLQNKTRCLCWDKAFFSIQNLDSMSKRKFGDSAMQLRKLFSSVSLISYLVRETSFLMTGKSFLAPLVSSLTSLSSDDEYFESHPKILSSGSAVILK